MLDKSKAFSSLSVNDIQKGQGILWQDAGARTFQRSGRHPGCASFRRHQSSDVL
jgi:hypothetical protein